MLNLENELEESAKKFQPDIAAADFTLTSKKAVLDLAQKEYDKAQMALYKSKKDQYDERIAIVKKHIDEEIMTMKAPSAYDKNRVAELRAILAKTKEQEYQSFDKRFEILKALRELQLIVTTFPFVERVGKLIEQWTGKNLVYTKKADQSFYPFNICLHGEKNIILKTIDRLRPFPGTPYYLQRNEDNNKSVIHCIIESNYCGLGISGSMHDFWEIDCARLQIRPEFLITDEPIRPKTKDNPNGGYLHDGRDEYRNAINRIGWEALWIKDRTVKADIIEELVASVIISSCPSVFTVNEIRSSIPYLLQDTDSIYPYMQCRSILNELIQFRVNTKLIIAKKDGIDHVHFIDRKLTWTTKNNESSVFDPDTCEMNQPGIIRHELDVSNVKLANVAEYAFKHIKGLTPHKA